MKDKILYISSGKSDYLQDLTYSGLVSLLGIDKVIEYPWNLNYHIPRKKYPRNMGYQKNTLFRSMMRLTDYSSVGLVIVGSCKTQAFEKHAEISGLIPAGIPVIFLDGGDAAAIGGDLIPGAGLSFTESELLDKFDLIFKREYLKTRDYPEKVLPLPFSFNYNNAVPAPQKPAYDVAFWAVESDPLRTQALTLLGGRFDCASNGTTLNQNFYDYKRKGLDYLKELALVKISLNFRGSGWDTMRYWEVPAVGSLMITPEPGIVIPDNFMEGEHIVFCKADLSDLLPLCEYYLAHETERKRIALAGAAFAREKHSHLARTSYMLRIIREKTGFNYTIR